VFLSGSNTTSSNQDRTIAIAREHRCFVVLVYSVKDYQTYLIAYMQLPQDGKSSLNTQNINRKQPTQDLLSISRKDYVYQQRKEVRPAFGIYPNFLPNILLNYNFDANIYQDVSVKPQKRRLEEEFQKWAITHIDQIYGQLNLIRCGSLAGLGNAAATEQAKQLGYWYGFPDLIVIGHKIVFVEFKVGDNKPSQNQIKTFLYLKKEGYDAYIVYTREAFAQIMKDNYGGKKKYERVH